MDLSFTPEQIAFREEVRSWIATALPPHLAALAAVDAQYGMKESMEWHKILYQKGWVAPHWPKEHGGPGLDATRRFILTEELELAGTPILSPFGLHMVGPLLMQFGAEAQQKRFLPPILAGEEVWCQGYSEPNAGSDLASLQTRAEDDGAGHFVVNGQKTWTTYAQYADWIFCLVRTDASVKKQAGISFLLIDMKSPGVTVRPTLTIGGTPSFSDTFFENVVVPKENVVGPLNGGWTVAKALLGHERTLIAAVGYSRRQLRRCKRIAAEVMIGGKPALEHPSYRARLAHLEIKLRAHQMANYRALAGAQLGHAPGPESSILKLVGSEIQQQCFELAADIMGENSLSWFNDPGVVPPLEQWVAPAYCYNRATTIYGGSNEIQKNIIAKWILGLPDR
ncbi:MAG: acyl-CoA dehydrogenase family protein [Deltaproteobacteria bacterium]|nr:acyl-CoA dehydrogenase family protein [Deltaproteobacteria bacterium]